MMAEKPDDDELPSSSSYSTEEDEKFKSDTEQVVKTFVYKRLTSQIDEEASGGNLDVASVPSGVMNELRSADNGDNADVDHDQQIRKIGKSLADFGDEIQTKYHATFTDMISRMNISSEESFAFESFCSVANKLFDQGINWGRIVALLCFGYQIAVDVIKQGSRGTIGFLRKLVRYLVQFIQQYISSWIGEQGGWLQSINHTGALPSLNTDLWSLAKYTGGAAVLLIASYVFIKSISKGS